jgi:STAM-binding protein
MESDINNFFSASTERGEPLRKLLLPTGVHSRFLSIAESNTRNKIETCGILAGTLVSVIGI